MVTRNKLRRGLGWLSGEADIGHCTRLGFYEGVRLLLCCTPTGAITGFGIGPASTNDRVLANTFFAARVHPTPALPSVGHAVSDCYLADMGFGGRNREQAWRTELGVTLICPPQTGSKRAWPKPWRRWVAGIRQVMETVTDRVLVPCGVDRLRPHALRGLQARLAAAIGLFNACVGSTVPISVPPSPLPLWSIGNHCQLTPSVSTWGTWRHQPPTAARQFGHYARVESARFRYARNRAAQSYHGQNIRRPNESASVERDHRQA